MPISRAWGLIALSSSEVTDEHPRTHILARPRSAVEDPDAARYATHLEAVARKTSQATAHSRLGYYIGAFHDFGKATSYFQEYVRGEREQSTYTNHSALSALAAFYALNSVPVDQIGRATAWYAISRHHGGMIDINDLFERSLTPERDDIYKAQAKALTPYAEQIKEAYAALGIEFDLRGFIDWISSGRYFSDVRKSLNYRGSVDPSDLPASSAYGVIEAYAHLVSSDRLDASGFDTPSRRYLPATLVDEYVDITFDDPEPGSINALREACRQVMKHTLRQCSLDTQQYTLTLPTGLGKTFTGLEAALILRDKIKGSTQAPPRIVYALPYTSIIDQNHAAFERVYETVTGSKISPQVAFKHHHLAPGYSGDTTLEMPSQKGSLLEARWESELVTTTYVQLLESLVTPNSQQALRLPNLRNAIVILDEPQSIPTKYWQLVDDVFEWATQEWNLYTIAMTATQPQVKKDGERGRKGMLNGKSLVPHQEPIFDRLRRVSYIFDTSVRTQTRGLDVETIAERTEALVSDSSGQDILCILNTKLAAQRTYDAIEARVSTTDVDLSYLSSDVRPIDRANRLDKLTNDIDEQRILISTQVVETGVDIDFDYVFRDLAPFDTLVQAAGRCNRNALTGDGTVEILRMSALDGHAEPPSRQVYDAVKLDATRATIDDVALGTAIAESRIQREFLPQYFRRLPDVTTLNASSEALAAWQFEAGAISLIDTETLDLFVVRSSQDRDLLAEFKNAIQNQDADQIRALRSQFYDRVVSVRPSQIDQDRLEREADRLDVSHDLYAVDTTQDDWDGLYDSVTGIQSQSATE